MGVHEVPSNDAFLPYRGSDKQIQEFSLKPGAVYFAYDTNKIYFDDAQSRHVMSGSGIKFVYGIYQDDILPDEDLLYPYPREAIDLAYVELNKDPETYQTEDIIVNTDGTLYRIKRIDDEYCYCVKLLVSGSGGGSGDSTDTWYVQYAKQFSPTIAKGQAATATLKAVNLKKRTGTCTVYIDLYESELALEPFTSQIVYTGQAINENINITIPADKLRVGLNNVRVYATMNGQATELEYDNFNVIDVHMEAGPSWNWLQPVQMTVSQFKFPYHIRGYADGEQFEVKARFVIDEDNGGLGFTETIKNTVNGEVDIYRLFKDVEHGAHSLDIHATITVNNNEVSIDDDALHWEIAWVDPTSTVPIIWSTYRHRTTEKNYSVINIPFMVYDPQGQNNQTTVTYYVNDEEVSTELVTMSTAEPLYWEVPYYNPEETNSFVIMDGEANPAEFIVYIEKDNSKDMDSVAAGCILHLSATGRSNNESSLKRAAWPNDKKAAESNDVGTVQLNNFNWYNNGWLKDEDGITVLRVSNGASVFIPLTLFNRSRAVPQTYEFDFRVRNAVDYSKLINLETVYEMENGEIKVDEQGNPIPKLNDLGDEIVEKKVASGGRGAFLQYYADNKGMMLGTQEAFIGYTANSNLNVRYTDNTRVKVSFVVDPTILNADNGEALIYAYIDGVLTGVLTYDYGTVSFEQNSPGITINSDYCDVDIYEIRVYNAALTFNQITQNWVGGSSTMKEREDRYNRNQSLTKNDQTTTAKVTLDYELARNSGLIPIMVFTTYDPDEWAGVSLLQKDLPFFKNDDSIAVKVRYYDPINPSKSFHCRNVQLNVQGTSSQGYPRRNYKLKIKKATTFPKDENGKERESFMFEKWDGVEANKDIYFNDSDHKLKKIDIGSGMAETKFCLKADYMDSSSSHNTPLANLVQVLSTQHTSFDLRHPLAQRETTAYAQAISSIMTANNVQNTFDLVDENTGETITYTQDVWKTSVSGDFRTTVYGYPILCFHEWPDGSMTYIGKYNFNLDKSATDSFGFTNKAINPYSEVKARATEGIAEVEIDGKTEELEGEADIVRPGTFAEVAECWELRQNQPGLSKFQDGDDFWALNNDGKYTVLADHFEARYHEPEIDNEVVWSNGVAEGNAWARPYLNNLYDLWNWIRSTDVTSHTDRQYATLDTPVYYKTLSSVYEPGINYYADTEGTPATITKIRQARLSALYSTDGNDILETGKSTITIGDIAYITQLLNYVMYDSSSDPTWHDEFLGPHSFIYDSINGEWTYGTATRTNAQMAAGGISSTNGFSGVGALEITVEEVYEGFDANLYEKFTRDSNRYRLAKFRNEFRKHLNLDYCLMYFVLTELLLLYDSRQKNMMIASWGPEETGGAYIWYPIFYDMDTQLGVNNSGQVYWDYDEDATPDLYMSLVLPQDWDGEADVVIKSNTNVTEQNPNGTTDSIFSGNGSVLWNNMYICFLNEIKTMYREMRLKDLSEANLNRYYNTMSSDKWSEIMKNLDAYFKYIAPAIPAEGYIDQSGNKDVSNNYFYCLQGDRKLNRQAFFRNRLNYIDSEWLGGDYDPQKTRANVKMRYNLNDRAKTSDQDTEQYAGLNSSATYQITPYLSQYVSVRYDQTVTTPTKYKLGSAAYIEVEPPENIKNRADGGIALSQQLAYLSGPSFISSLGDLSDKYLNEFNIDSASRLRDVIVGNEDPRYFNRNLTDLKINAKGLLREVNLTNLSELTADPVIGGCSKLEILKCLGTNFSTVTLPNGSILKRVYLPKTLTNLTLIKPLVLTNIITDKANAALNNNTDGLYVEDLTDKLSTPITAATTSKIDVYRMDDTLMGYHTYNMLKYLFDVKVAKSQGTVTDTGTSPNLRISVENANWTPYAQLEIDAIYDGTKNYYVRNDDGTFEDYAQADYTPSSWNLGLLNGVLYTDSGFGQSPVADLSMFDRFIADYDDRSVTYAQCQFKPIVDDLSDNTRKMMPVITGKIHVNNDELHPIKESDIANKYNAANHFPKLDITANYITPANRAMFVEYDADTGARTILYTQKVDSETTDVTPVVYNGTQPSRLHYDFLGWVLDTGSVDWQAKGSIENEWKIGDGHATTDLSSYDLSQGSYTFVAVYSLHSYTITYLMDDGTPFYYQGNNVTSLAVAGSYITLTPLVPYKDDTGLALTQTYHFDGWRAALDSEDLIDSWTGVSQAGKMYIKASKDMNVYAKFTEESVYAHPLTLDKLQAEYSASDGGFGVTINPDAGLKGKICFPKSLTVGSQTADVISTLALSINESGNESTYSPLSHNDDIYAVFFEGANDGTSTIRIISQGTFEADNNLMYVDLPDSITHIYASAFAQCVSLTNNVMPTNLYHTDSASFNGAWSNIEGGIALKLPTAFIERGNWGPWAFYSGAGVASVQMGTPSSRITRFSRTEEDAPTMFSTGTKNWTVYVASGSGLSEAIVRGLIFKLMGGSVDDPGSFNITVDIG